MKTIDLDTLKQITGGLFGGRGGGGGLFGGGGMLGGGGLFNGGLRNLWQQGGQGGQGGQQGGCPNGNCGG